MLSKGLRDAIETLLAGPYSEDEQGYAHFIDMQLFEDLRTAYHAAIQTPKRPIATRR